MNTNSQASEEQVGEYGYGRTNFVEIVTNWNIYLSPNHETIPETMSCRKAFHWKLQSNAHGHEDLIDLFNNMERTAIFQKGGLPRALTEPYGYTSAPSILLSIMAIILNIFVIRFYRKTELTVVSLLYTFIAVMDIICAVGTIYQYITLGLCVHADVGAGKPFDINTMIFLFLMQVGYRCSVFGNLVLAVSRTIMIAKPFYEINKKAIKLVCIFNAVLLIVLYSFNVYAYIDQRLDLDSRKLYFEIVLSFRFLIGFGLKDILPSQLEIYNLEFLALFLPDILAFVIPVIIVIITCIVQIISIRRSSQCPITSSNQRHVTITVLLMSTLFVVCNTPLSIYIASLVFADSEEDDPTDILNISFGTILPLLNGVLNPVIIISRSSDMKRKFKATIQRMKWWDRAGQEIKKSKLGVGQKETSRLSELENTNQVAES